MSPRVRWEAAEPAAQRAVERWLETGDGAVLHDGAQRRIVRIASSCGADLLVKHFRVGSGSHPWRDRLRALAGQSPADREWRALRALSRAELAVPRPRALGTLANGDRLLAMEYVDAARLCDAMVGPRPRRELAVALGRTIAALHAQGFVHGDLHHGNVLSGAAGPVLVDLQRARLSRSEAARRRDLAHLDHSLAPYLSTAGRVRLRAAALGLARPFGPAARDAIRAIGRACAQRALAHGASRRRHVMRAGRAVAAVRVAGARGLRVREIDEAAVSAALAAHEAALAAGDSRVLDRDRAAALCAVTAGQHRIVSKEARGRGLARALADCVRGSPGRRAWRGGHGLRLLGIGAAAPLAYLEWTRLGLPVRSLVLLEDLRPDPGAHRVLETAAPETRDAALDALLGLVLALHRAGADHGDLKASNVLLRATAGGFEPRLVDLEGVRFSRRVPDALRIRALAQLNASVGDALPPAPRRRFFARYAQALRFEAGADAARAATVRESLARRHRWSGCAAAPSADAPAPDPSAPNAPRRDASEPEPAPAGSATPGCPGP